MPSQKPNKIILLYFQLIIANIGNFSINWGSIAPSPCPLSQEGEGLDEGESKVALNYWEVAKIPLKNIHLKALNLMELSTLHLENTIDI